MRLVPDSTSAKLGLIGLALVVVASAVGAAITRAHETSGQDEAAKVCGSIVSAEQAAQLRGMPVMVTLDRAYAGEDLTVVMLGGDRASLDAADYPIGQHLCVSGRVRSFFGKPRMVLDAAMR